MKIILFYIYLLGFFISLYQVFLNIKAKEFKTKYKEIKEKSFFMLSPVHIQIIVGLAILFCIVSSWIFLGVRVFLKWNRR